jgi:bifunctional DNA-binding transcriptional regulator/antitoxin component of YhaV-PrlF toxin-antitoxin module
MRFIKRVSDRGTVTLPSDVRRALDVDEGDIIEFDIISIVRRKDRQTGVPVRVSDLLETVAEDEDEDPTDAEAKDTRGYRPADASGG